MQIHTIYELKRKIEFWQQQLRFIQNGNIQFKAQLAEILRKKDLRGHLDQLEEFQNRFLQLDEQITLLRHEIREHWQKLQADILLPETEQAQQHLEDRLIAMNWNFNRLNNDFYSYLQEYSDQ